MDDGRLSKRSVEPRIKEFIDNEVLARAKTFHDLQNKWKLTIPVDVTDTFLLIDGVGLVQVVRLTYVVLLHGETTEEKVEHFTFGDGLRGTVATLENPTGRYRLRIAQLSGQKDMKVNVERLPPRST